jgi:hypothetical protein
MTSAAAATRRLWRLTTPEMWLFFFSGGLLVSFLLGFGFARLLDSLGAAALHCATP